MFFNVNMAIYGPDLGAQMALTAVKNMCTSWISELLISYTICSSSSTICSLDLWIFTIFRCLQICFIHREAQYLQL